MEILSNESLTILAVMITVFWASLMALAVAFAIDGSKANK